MLAKLGLGLAVLGLGTALISAAAIAQDNMQSRQPNYQDKTMQTQQPQNYQDHTMRSQQQNDRDTMQSRQRQAMAPNSEQTRPRATRRMTMIRRTGRHPAARNMDTARNANNDEYLRSAAGPGNVAANAPPPQRQSYGWNGPAGGNGDRYYDRYSGQGFAANAGFGQPAAMDQGSIAACQARFRSFDPASGTYLGFDGIRHPCP